jgi:hypothetical protein
MKMPCAALVAVVALSACVHGAVRVDTEPSIHLAAMRSAESASSNEQSEFDHRRLHSAAGQFLTADVLAANRDLSLAQVLSTYILGFATGGGVRGSGVETRCKLHVFVNGLPADDTFDAIRPHDLIGVEYYKATSAPIKYRRAFSECPVLLLWLKP